MTGNNINEAIIVDSRFGPTDSFEVRHPTTHELIFRNRRPEPAGLSPTLQMLGAGNTGNALMNFSLIDATTKSEVLRMVRSLTGFGFMQPFEMYDGSGRLLVRFRRKVTLTGEVWKFWDEQKAPTFEVSIKRHGGPLTSVVTARYVLSANGTNLATIEPWAEAKTEDMAKKRCRLLKMQDAADSVTMPADRFLRFGIAISLARILSFRQF
jgi:hypothetical protein